MPAESDPRIYFAAERTFLAWIRTGLGLMGVGFAVSRFGLFLRQMSATQGHNPTSSPAHSVVAGAALVILGVVVNLGAVINHFQITRHLAEGTWQPGKVSTMAVALALLLAIVGAGMAVYLLLVR